MLKRLLRRIILSRYRKIPTKTITENMSPYPSKGEWVVMIILSGYIGCASSYYTDPYRKQRIFPWTPKNID